MQPETGNEIVEMPSHHSVDETVEKLKEILEAKGVKLFALVDHSGEAEKAGLKMPPTKLLIFGNPNAGTTLMLAAPGSAIDLPLKILVRQDTHGKTRISYNTPAYLQWRTASHRSCWPTLLLLKHWPQRPASRTAARFQSVAGAGVPGRDRETISCAALQRVAGPRDAFAGGCGHRPGAALRTLRHLQHRVPGARYVPQPFAETED